MEMSKKMSKSLIPARVLTPTCHAALSELFSLSRRVALWAGHSSVSLNGLLTEFTY